MKNNDKKYISKNIVRPTVRNKIFARLKRNIAYEVDLKVGNNIHNNVWMNIARNIRFNVGVSLEEKCHE